MDFDFDIGGSDTETFTPDFEFPLLDTEFPAFDADIPTPVGAVTPQYSILSESVVSDDSDAETIRHEILPATDCNTTSMSPVATAAESGREEEDQTQCPPEDTEPLKVDANSCLAGYSYETSQGRYIVFYWQRESRDSSTPGGVYLSTFTATNLSWTMLHEPYLVAQTARQGTPLAAVHWSNGLKSAVYFLDQRNLLCERVTQDGGKTWEDGMLTKQCLAARANSDIAADVIWEEMDKLQIFVYFQGGGRNGIRQLKSSGHFPETKWVEDTGNNYNTLKALSGTSILCGHDFFCCDKQWIYTQSPAKEVQKHRLKNGSWETSATKYFTGSFDRKVRLGYCADSRLRRLYLHDGSQVTERTRPRHHAGEWNEQTLLPSGTGIPRIGHNFVVLQWPQDVDDTASQIHLFSLLDGKLQDYIVGLANGASYSLVDVA